MALCLAVSLLERGFDPGDQMERYCRWLEHGYMSSTGRCFDIGTTTRLALKRYRSTGDPFSGTSDPAMAGNGSIMRLAPIPMFFFPDEQSAIEFSGTSSRTTHGAAECVDAARVLGGMLTRALAGRDKHEVLLGGEADVSSPAAAAIVKGAFLEKSESDIRGSGYVIESLEAALWCFARSVTFEDAVLRAVNLGDDADTTAAVCGQVAGAYYGESGIPAHWLERLFMAQEIAHLADRLHERAGRVRSTDGEPRTAGREGERTTKR